MRVRHFTWTCCLAAAACCGPALAADEPGEFQQYLDHAGRMVVDSGQVKLVQFEAPSQQPLDLDVGGFAPTSQQPLDLGISGAFTPSFGDPLAPLGTTETALQNTPSVEGTSGQQGQIIGATDAGDLLEQSPQIQTVSVRRRSPLASDPFVRGYHVGQIYTEADGVWIPVRQDLDSILSKIDPSLIDNVSIVPGPYGLRYGPGLAFIKTDYIDTPRYNNGYEIHNRAGVTYRANGGQVYGRDTIYGGNSNYGFIVNYNNRTGSDYEAGNGLRIPSSYHAQNFFGQFGFDLSADSQLDFRYQRLDQTDTEYAAQFFDVNYLVTDSYHLALTRQDPNFYAESRVEGWYNRTRFAGDTRKDGKRLSSFPVLQRVDAAVFAAGFGSSATSENFNGDTNGDLTSAGARWTKTYGQDGDSQFRAGTDFRFMEQHLAEEFLLQPDPASPQPIEDRQITTNLPRAHMVDPGLFAELILPVQPFWTTSIGGRVDWVHTDAEDMGGFPDGLRDSSSLVGAPSSLDQNDILYHFYLTNDVDLDANWSTRFGFGHAQRVPTLTERYADGVFLAIIQSGFSRVIGRPNLDKERAWQIDWSVNAEYENVRARATAFHAWIHDYVTYEANVVADPTGARLLRAVNTDLATLAGFELAGDVDLTSMLSTFATMRFVDGRDREIDQPLPGIAPLEARLGLRLTDEQDGSRWGTEFGARIVDNQDRLGSLRRVGVPGTAPLELATPGFTVFYVRGYRNITENFNVVGGIENLFDRTYLEHLDLRLPADSANGFAETRVLSPGFTPYIGGELVY